MKVRKAEGLAGDQATHSNYSTSSTTKSPFSSHTAASVAAQVEGSLSFYFVIASAISKRKPPRTALPKPEKTSSRSMCLPLSHLRDSSGGAHQKMQFPRFHDDVV